MGKKTRLITFLMRSGRFSDAAGAEAAIRKGRVSVEGKIVTSPRFEFRPSTRGVVLDGKALEERKSQLYIILDKPVGVICQKGDAAGRRSVWDVVQASGILTDEEVRSLVSVGRLDVDTEGLLLLTTDGDLVDRLLQPQTKVEKEYVATVEGRFGDEDVASLEKGVRIPLKSEEGRGWFTTLPAQVAILASGRGGSKVSVVVCEGKKRQVRLMLAAVGHPVVALRRVRIGGLRLERRSPGRVARMEREQLLDALFGKRRR